MFVFPKAPNEIYYLYMEKWMLEENKIVCGITISRSKNY